LSPPDDKVAVVWWRTFYQERHISVAQSVAQDHMKQQRGWKRASWREALPHISIRTRSIITPHVVCRCAATLQTVGRTKHLRDFGFCVQSETETLNRNIFVPVPIPVTSYTYLTSIVNLGRTLEFRQLISERSDWAAEENADAQVASSSPRLEEGSG
jgi:hypothetical protein